MIPADQWKKIDESIEATKDKYGLRGVEIHTAWMSRRYAEQGGIQDFVKLSRSDRRSAAETAINKRAGIIGVRGNVDKIKDYRRLSKAILPYLHLTRAERQQCLQDLAHRLASFREVRIFADAISKPDFIPGFNNTPYEMAFEQVLTRCQTCLSKKGGIGIVVHDNNSTVAPRLTELSREFHKYGTFYRKIPNIVETPLFVDSTLTSMIQMADLCAYALRRFIEKQETLLWPIVEPLADRHGGLTVGVRHFTGKRYCDCPTCLAHGRESASPQA